MSPQPAFAATRTVFFDLVGTLVEPRQPVGEQYARVARRHGVDLDGRALEAGFHEAMRTTPPCPVQESLEATAAAERRWWRDLVRRVTAAAGAAGLDREDLFDAYFDDLFEHFTTAEAWQLFDDTLPALDGLAALHVTAGLITNFDTRVYRVLDALGLAARLDLVVIPAVAGSAKPEPGIFTHALERAGVRLGEAVHVGDSMGDDYEGATAAGIPALLLDRKGRYEGTPGLRTIRGLDEVASALGNR